MAQAPAGQERRNRRPEIQPEEKQYDERTLHIDRVARVVKGGRRFRFRALVVVGDRKNRVGIGSAKGADVTAAVTKATEVAKKHFVTVSLYKGTLPHETEAKVGGVVRTILEVSGVHNALSKSLGSTNKTNTAYATVAALESLVPASKWVTTTTTHANKSKAATAAKIPAEASVKEQPAATKKVATSKQKATKE
jgi:small subunit ribosomal protein S5